MRSVWGSEMAMVFQDPMTSLNPVMKIGRQITESLRFHLDMDKDEASDTAVALLASVGIPEPAQRFGEYPHQLSGGMRQRVTIAIALACGPKLLFADEPTTALDVTVQAQILNLLKRQQTERHMAMILVTHDLGVVAGRTDEIAVMYAGQIVEQAPTPRALRQHAHALHRGPAELDPQTRPTQPHQARDHRGSTTRSGQPTDGMQLRPSLQVRPTVPRGTALIEPSARPLLPLLVDPDCEPGTSSSHPPMLVIPSGPWRQADMAGSGTDHLRRSDNVLLRADSLVVEFPVGSTGLKVHAVTDVSIDVLEGETLGLVGESGCGKSTTGKALMQLPTPTSGQVFFDGTRPHRAQARGPAPDHAPRCR